WGCCNLGLILWLLTVKQTEWILGKAHLAVRAAVAEQRSVVVLQSLNILRTAVAVANAVDVDTNTCQPEPCVDLVEQANQFRINGWIVFTQSLTAKLVVFAVAASLRLVTPEHRQTHIIDLDRLGQFEHTMLKIGTHNACC